MIARRMTPVKGICAKKQHSLKIDKTDRKTQEICRFILQEGCNLGQQKKAVLTELPFSKALHSCPLLLFIVRHPRQIHQRQRRRNGGEFFALNLGFDVELADARIQCGDHFALGLANA